MTGRNNNFNLLRVCCATLVLYYHSFPLSMGAAGAHEPLGELLGYGVGTIGVTVFFVISGFLVTKSYHERENVLSFVEARFLRIVPALAALAFFCVLIIGPLFTRVSLAHFSSTRRHYGFFTRTLR